MLSGIVSNAFRGLFAEFIVDAALSTNNWRMCSGDWQGWDFEHADACRLEVKLIFDGSKC